MRHVRVFFVILQRSKTHIFMSSNSTKPLSNFSIWANTTLTFVGAVICLLIVIKSAFIQFNWQNLLVSAIGLTAFTLAFVIEIRREKHTYKMFYIIVWCYALAILLNSILFPYTKALETISQSDASRATALLESVLVFAALFTFNSDWRNFKSSKILISVIFFVELITAILLSTQGLNAILEDSSNKFLTIASLYLRPVMAGALAVTYITHWQAKEAAAQSEDAQA